MPEKPSPVPPNDFVIDKLKSAQSVVLSTHRYADGDGLGAEIALALALKKAGRNVRILNCDSPPARYDFMGVRQLVQSFDGPHDPLGAIDLALILDTNDPRLVEPLFSQLKASAQDVLFIDHHPSLKAGPAPRAGSWIEPGSASTGELIFRLLQGLQIPLDREIARALYVSLVFDTQLFRYVRSSPTSHEISAELLRYDIHPEEIHRKLFATSSVEKLQFLTRALSAVEYALAGRIGFVYLDREIFGQTLNRDESGDVIDLLMDVETIEVAALLREDAPGEYKLSLRSKGRIPVLPIAEVFGGGGHVFSAGAFLKGNKTDLQHRILDHLRDQIGGDIQ